jgi:hypothetical protein
MSKQNSMIEWIDKRFPLTSNWKAIFPNIMHQRILISGITLVLWHY